MRPTMIVVAGPPGSGKSTVFPVSGFGVAFFNADDRAAALNGGSYTGISRQIRQQVNRQDEEFVVEHISRRESFAIETTLRSEVTFEQARHPGQPDSESKCAIWRSMGFRSIWSA
jgi:predicted ABC-type ATPase